LRIGSIEFINSLPIDLGLLTGAIPGGYEMIQGTPAILNEMISKAHLGLGPVSSFWYGQHQKDFLLLPDLSISSESGVQSVSLFSRHEMRDLKGREIIVTQKGRTTPVLFHILCRLRDGFEPRFHASDKIFKEIPKNANAILLIGDEALTLKENLKDPAIKIFDLAEEWKRWTKLPFVFAVWAVRRDFFANDPEKVFLAHEALLESKAWGLKHLEQVVKTAATKIDLSEKTLRAYFSGISYDFDERLKKGLRLYFDLAEDCGLLKEAGDFEEIEPLRSFERKYDYREYLR